MKLLGPWSHPAISCCEVAKSAASTSVWKPLLQCCKDIARHLAGGCMLRQEGFRNTGKCPLPEHGGASARTLRADLNLSAHSHWPKVIH